MIDNAYRNPSFEMTNIEAIGIGLASPEKILEWSRGEVKKPETDQLPNPQTRTGRTVLRKDLRAPERLGVPLRQIQEDPVQRHRLRPLWC